MVSRKVALGAGYRWRRRERGWCADDQEFEGGEEVVVFVAQDTVKYGQIRGDDGPDGREVFEEIQERKYGCRYPIQPQMMTQGLLARNRASIDLSTEVFGIGQAGRAERRWMKEEWRLQASRSRPMKWIMVSGMRRARARTNSSLCCPGRWSWLIDLRKDHGLPFVSL